MQHIIAVFWNARERRIRAAWRLLLQLAAMGIICAAWQISLPRGPVADRLNDIGAIILAACIIAAASRWLDRRPLSELGLHPNRRWWWECATGLAAGAALMSALFATGLAAGWFSVTEGRHAAAGLDAVTRLCLLTPAYFIAVGLAEELYFRGSFMRNLAEGLHDGRTPAKSVLWTAAVLSAALFAEVHSRLDQTTLLSWINTFLAGMMLAVAVLNRGSLACAIGFHIAWNYFQGGVFGLAVSGAAEQASWLAVDVNGPSLWTGGAYGPEGGLLGTFAFSLALALILLWGRAARGSWSIQTDWAAPPAA